MNLLPFVFVFTRMRLTELIGDHSSATWLEFVVSGGQLLALLTVPSVLLRRRGQPKAALSWLLALFAIPLLGVVAWWAVGRTNIDRKRKRRSSSSRRFRDRHGRAHSEHGTPFDRVVPSRALGESVFASAGNLVDLCLDGGPAFAAMEAAIQGAKSTVYVLFYIWHDDETGRRFRDLCASKAREGVVVRVLVDAWGSPRFTRAFSKPLREAGAHVASFMPSKLYPLRAPRLNFANHRKIVVVDGCVAFTGGMNVGDEYATQWRDMMLRVEGPAARALEHVFLDDWFFATDAEIHHEPHPLSPPGNVACAVVASGPDREAWIHDAYFVAFTRAERRIWVVTPYFIPSGALLAALRTAADRGVDVRIVVPWLTDVRLVKWAARSYYPELLSAGVRIYEYRGPMLHAKAILVDDALSCVGSANIDTRSFLLSFEVSCFVHDAVTNRTLSSWFDETLDDSREIALDAFENRSTFQKLLESAAHLLSPLL